MVRLCVLAVLLLTPLVLCQCPQSNDGFCLERPRLRITGVPAFLLDNGALKFCDAGSPSATRSQSPTPSQTPTNTPTPSVTPTGSPTQSSTQSSTASTSTTPTPTNTPTNTPSNTPSSSASPTKTSTQTSTQTPSQSPTQSATASLTASPSQTPTSTVSPSPSHTCPGNIVASSGFENISPATVAVVQDSQVGAWTNFGFSGVLFVDSTRSYVGQSSYGLVNGCAARSVEAGIFQNLVTAPGFTYQVTVPFAGGCTASSVTNSFSIRITDTSTAFRVVLADSSFSTTSSSLTSQSSAFVPAAELTFFAPGTSVELRLYAKSTDANPAILDEVCMRAIAQISNAPTNTPSSSITASATPSPTTTSSPSPSATPSHACVGNLVLTSGFEGLSGSSVGVSAGSSVGSWTQFNFGGVITVDSTRSYVGSSSYTLSNGCSARGVEHGLVQNIATVAGFQYQVTVPFAGACTSAPDTNVLGVRLTDTSTGAVLFDQIFTTTRSIFATQSAAFVPAAEVTFMATGATTELRLYIRATDDRPAAVDEVCMRQLSRISNAPTVSPSISSTATLSISISSTPTRSPTSSPSTSPSHTCVGNVVATSGFEGLSSSSFGLNTGQTLGSWTNFGFGGVLSIDSTRAYVGVASYVMSNGCTGRGVEHGIFQNIATVVGGTYQVTIPFSGSCTSSVVNNSFGIRIQNAAGLTVVEQYFSTTRSYFITPGAAAFVPAAELTFVATSTSTTLRLFVTATESLPATVDEVCVRRTA